MKTTTMKIKMPFLITPIFSMLIFIHTSQAQISIPELNTAGTNIHYVKAVGKRIQSKYYYIFDYGQAGIESVKAEFLNSYGVSDSSSLIRNISGSVLSFNSMVDFLNSMYNTGWELMYNEPPYYFETVQEPGPIKTRGTIMAAINNTLLFKKKN